jgi:hypothetical protein
MMSLDRKLPVLLGIFSLLGAVTWTAVVHFASGLSGMGDGAADIVPVGEFRKLYSGSLYLLLLSVSCLPFIRGALLAAIGAFGHLVLVFFATHLILGNGAGAIVLLIPFAGFAAGWRAVWRMRSAYRKKMADVGS